MTREELVFVDDRPTTLARKLLARGDVQPVLLRFSHVLHELPAWWLERTSTAPAFVVDSSAPPVLESARFASWCRANGLAPRRFLNPSEPRQRIAHRFARAVRLPALADEQVDWVRDKAAMKEKLAALGFVVPAFARVRTLDDAAAFARRHGFPVVIKPLEGSACRNTFRIDGANELAAVPFGAEPVWVAEAFVRQREYECCALVRRGRVLAAFVSSFPAPPLAASLGAINANVSMRHLPATFGIDPAQTMQRIVSGMRLRDGYLHVEFFLDESRFVMGEVGFRIAGCEIPSNHSFAYGFDIHDALIDVHLDREPDLRFRADRYVGDLLLPCSPGTCAGVTPIAELHRLPGVFGGAMRLGPGDTAPAERASHVAAGYVHVEGDSVAQVEQRMRAVLATYRYSVREAAVV